MGNRNQDRSDGSKALVVEGGGMRGIFSAGVLDAFLEMEFDPFNLYIGVSAGACNLASHLGGQYQRNYKIYTHYCTRPEFMNLKKLEEANRQGLTAGKRFVVEFQTVGL